MFMLGVREQSVEAVVSHGLAICALPQPVAPQQKLFGSDGILSGDGFRRHPALGSFPPSVQDDHFVRLIFSTSPVHLTLNSKLGVSHSILTQWVVLNLVDEALDQMALLEPVFIVPSLLCAIGSRRDDCLSAYRSNKL
jgi:hypothetical protein